MEGYVMLQREHATNGMLQNPELWQMFCYLMLKASYKEREVVFNDSLIKLKPGQCIIGRKKIAQELNTTEAKVRTNLNKLTKIGFLAIESTNRYSVATLVRWEVEQSSNQPINQPDNQTLTNHQPDFNHKQESNKERKEERNINDDVHHLFDKYLEMNIFKHQKITPKMKTNANARLKEYSVENLKNAIENYAEVLKGNQYYWTHKWRFDDLMKPNGITKFLDESEPMTNYLKNEYKGQQQQKQPVDEVSQEQYDKGMAEIFGE